MYASVRNAFLVGASVIAIVAAGTWALAQEQGAGGTTQQQGGGGTPPQPQEGGGGTPPQPQQGGGTPAQQQEGGGTSLPQVTVTAPTQPKQRPKVAPKQKTVSKGGAPKAAPATTPTPPTPPTPEQTRETANRTVVERTNTLDQRRDTVLLPKTGANTDTKDLRDLEDIPQGGNAQLSDIVLQFPGVSNDSTNQGDFHIRNEHGNVQFRINGILLPDGVSGFSQILETGLFRSMTLVTGALPAQYGLRTSGIVDLTTKTGPALAGGSVSLYGGSRETMTGSFEYGGVIGQTDFFTTGRVLSTNLGLENPIATPNAIHDNSVQGRFFTYTSTMLDPQTRFSTITGMAESKFQIPTNPGQPAVDNPNGTVFYPGFTAWGIPASSFNSANINQNQYEKNFYGVAAWQRSVENLDVQLAYYNRYSDLHFVPDLVGDMSFNAVASDVFRSSFLNGIAGDAAYRLGDTHILRGGFYTNAEFTRIKNITTVEATDPANTVAFEPPFNIADTSDKFGWQFGGYVADEWRIAPKLTAYYGLRFDQIYQYVNANQLSPRASVTYEPWWGAIFHAGYARYFTPPPQDLGRTVPNGIFNMTTGAPPQPNVGSILPERANVYDVGIVQQVLPSCAAPVPPTFAKLPVKAPVASADCPSLEIGVDAYYKQARDLIDDGQFGQAYVLTAFNYARGINRGVEAKAKFRWGNFRAYMNWAKAVQKGTDIVSNQSLFDLITFQYIASHAVYTDHTQILTGSAGLSYLFTPGPAYWWDMIKISASFIYGGGLRQDLPLAVPIILPAGPLTAIPNGDHLPAYQVVNTGISKEFKGWGWEGQPVTVRFDVVNLFDKVYLIRGGSGIGVFAPQFGPRRGYYLGISQKLGDPAAGYGRFEPAGAGMYTKAPVTPLVYSWTDFYAGVHFGGAFSKEDVTVGPALFGTPMVVATNPSGVLGGVQVGYNYQLAPNAMIGAEAELSFTSAQGKGDPFNAFTAGAVQSDQRWYDTFTARVGYVDGPLLVYAKGGAAMMNARYQLTAQSGFSTPPGVNGYARIDNIALGWTVGAGLEYLLSPNWSAKAEYEFLDFGPRTIGAGAIVPGNFLQVASSVHELKAGVNYHFHP